MFQTQHKTDKMFRLTALTIVLVSSYCLDNVYARTDCSLGNSPTILHEILQSCPPILDPSKDQCCYDIVDGRFYCCDHNEFIWKTGFGIVVPAVSAVAVIIVLIVCCVSCICCSCCPWYKRRHPGTVYGRVQPPVVQVIQAQPNTASNYPVQPPQNPYVQTAYPAQSTAMPMPEPPPQYTSEAYAKQAPYNPNYRM